MGYQSQSRGLRRFKWIRALVSFSVAVALLLTASQRASFSQAISNPNQIRGTISFTNTDPNVLDILNPSPRLDQGFVHAGVSAGSVVTVTHPVPFTAYTTAPATTRTSIDYEVTVETREPGSPPDGIAYNVSVEGVLGQGLDQYFFVEQVSAPVLEDPDPNDPAHDVILDFAECAAILHIRWVDPNLNPVSITGGLLEAFRETSPMSGQFLASAQATSFVPSNVNVSDDYMAVRGDGTLYKVKIFFDTGTDPFFDKIRDLCEVQVTGSCDQVVDIPCVVPLGGGSLGRIIGEIDMLREDEHPIGFSTYIQAISGPFDNARVDTLNDLSPSEGPYALENLVPSDRTTPPKEYFLFGSMAFRTGGRYEVFITPVLGGSSGSNAGVLVSAGVTTDLANTYVMDPGYVSGDILLAGPPAASVPEGFCLQGLRRASDVADPNGIPLATGLVNSSLIYAEGINRTGPGATKTALLATARVLFEGGYNTTTSNFEGDYEQVLAGLLGESSVWEPSELLTGISIPDVANPPNAHDVAAFMRNPGIGERDIVPGQTLNIPLHYCYSRVNLGFHSTSGTFFFPEVNIASASFNGVDFEGNPANYTVAGGGFGQPSTLATASGNGLVAMCLPQADYVLRPFVQSVNPGGGTSRTAVPPISLTVGCRQIIDLVPDLSLGLTTPPACSATQMINLTGAVNSDANVVATSVSLNGGAPSNVCTNCGVDPALSFSVTLADCDNTISVTAEDEFGNTASVTTFTRFDLTPPAVTCPPDASLQGDPLTGTAPGTSVPLPATSADNCDGTLPVTCDAPALYPAGATIVTCTTGADICGNVGSCSFDVTVLIREDCNDGVDNDGDGLIDGQDPDCFPLVVDLVSFEAKPDRRGITLTWTTATEIDTAGFLLLRGESASGPFRPITPVLIPGRGSPVSGAAYVYEDRGVRRGRTYNYLLVDVDLSGTETRHGPVEASSRRAKPQPHRR